MKHPKQCDSCPFLPLNHEAFGRVAKALCKKFGQPEPDFWQVQTIRERVVADAIQNGKLLCHRDVYDGAMNAHPQGARPCAGLLQHLSKSK